MRPKPIKFSCSRLRAPASERSTQGGFSLPEVLTAIVLGALILGVTSIAFAAFLKRAWANQIVVQAESMGSRMAASITTAMKTSSAWSIYPDKASYLADPLNNVSSQGNALVCQTKTASGQPIVVLFAYEGGQLTRAEASAANRTNSISNVSPISGSVFNQNLGLVSGGFAIQTPLERLTFYAYGTSLHMR